MKHNNLSDLAIAIKFVDESGQPCGIPVYDFELEFFTHPEFKKVVASQHNGEFTNCSVIDGTLVCYFDKPKLGRGRLRTLKIFHIPDEDFPDKENTVAIAGELDVDIV